MAAAGYGAVGEFHYVHHRPDGRPYDDPNALAVAVAEAGVAAGLTVVLLPAAYHRAGWDGGRPSAHCGPAPLLRSHVEDFLGRVDALREWAAERPHVRVGVAAHSVRAVPAEWLTAIAEYADPHGLVRHVHAAEQRRELAECEREHGCRPVELLERTGFLGERTSVMHGIHVSRPRHRAAGRERHDRRVVPDHRGQPGRRSPAGPALPRRRREAGHRQRLPGPDRPFEEARELETGARREGQTRHGLLAASGDLWGELARNGRGEPRSGGRERRARDTSTSTTPTWPGVADEDLELALATCASAGVVVGSRGLAPPDPR